MYTVRPVDGGVGSTLLLGRDVGQMPNCSLPALVTRPELVAATWELAAELSGPVRPIAGGTKIIALVEKLVAEGTPLAVARTSTAATPLLPLRDYLSSHLGESVPTATLVEMSGLTESHFIRAFHHEFGLPPHAYHLALRLAHACELLARGESVSTVAYDCGFADQSHLSRKFKEVYRVAPGAWARVVGDRAFRPRPLREPFMPRALVSRAPMKQLHGETGVR
jgi:AraC-like DNA-binding protein